MFVFANWIFKKKITGEIINNLNKFGILFFFNLFKGNLKYVYKGIVGVLKNVHGCVLRSHGVRSNCVFSIT